MSPQSIYFYWRVLHLLQTFPVFKSLTAKLPSEGIGENTATFRAA